MPGAMLATKGGSRKVVLARKRDEEGDIGRGRRVKSVSAREEAVVEGAGGSCSRLRGKARESQADIERE